MPSKITFKRKNKISKGDMAKGPIKPDQVPSIDAWEDATDESDVIHLVKLNKLEERTYKILKKRKRIRFEY